MSEKGSDWENEGLIDAILRSTPGYEGRIFQRYAERLTWYASTRMPGKLRGRVDSDDIVQSVFRSFFRRHRDGEFSFEESLDLWNLLVAMTYRKVLNQVRHHTREKRDVNMEGSAAVPGTSESSPWDLSPGPEQINIMIDYLNWILDKLPVESRKIVTLRLESYSISEIASREQVSQRTVKRVLSRVRELAKKQVECELND